MAETRLNLPSTFYEPEERALLVSAETKRLWAVELDLLAELQRVCRKHDIQFFAISGTLIGAARHHGFIPWDDDIDVVMMRSEYKRLEQVAPEEFKEPYFFQTNQTDPGSLRGHAQLRNSTTTAILSEEAFHGRPLYGFNQGVFLDIFPLDNLPDDAKERQRLMVQLKKLKLRMKCYRAWKMFAKHWRLFPKNFHWLKTMCHWMWLKVREAILRRDLLSDACNQFEQLAQSYNDTDAKECSPIAFSQALRRHEVFRVSDFDRQVELDFETMKIPCPQNYDEVLTRAFGDWHKHVIGKSSHGSVLIDLDKSYREYLNG